MVGAMQRRPEPLGTVAAALPSCRVLLLFAGVLALAESAALGTVLFALAAVTFGVSLVLGTLIYRQTEPVGDNEVADV
jgi:hypothetical protein